jgi:hypothetical protein
MPKLFLSFSYTNKQREVHIVKCRSISRQHQKYAHAAIEKALQEVFSMWSAPCLLLGNGSLNTFPQKQARGTIEHRLLGNGAVNTVFSVR